MDNWKRAGISNIAVGSFITVFFLFGLGIAWLVPVLIADPGKFIEVISQFSTARLSLLGLCAVPFLYGLFTIYRGISMLTGWKFSNAASSFLGDILQFAKDMGGGGARGGRQGETGKDGKN
jgi:hypothetical protein